MSNVTPLFPEKSGLRMQLEIDGDVPVIDLVRALTAAGFAVSNQPGRPLLIHKMRTPTSPLTGKSP